MGVNSGLQWDRSPPSTILMSFFAVSGIKRSIHDPSYLQDSVDDPVAARRKAIVKNAALISISCAGNICPHILPGGVLFEGFCTCRERTENYRYLFMLAFLLTDVFKTRLGRK